MHMMVFVFSLTILLLGAPFPRRDHHAGVRYPRGTARGRRARGDRSLESAELRRLQRDVLAGVLSKFEHRHHV